VTSGSFILSKFQGKIVPMDNIDSTSTPLQLSGPQTALYGALLKEDEALGCMYYGALSVFHQSSNPDRIPLAAHGLRELMEKLPRYQDVPKEAKRVTLKDKVQSLRQNWHRVVKNSGCHKEGAWSGHIDKFLKTFLDKTHEFFAWLEQQQPTRKQSAAKILRGFDLLKRPLPEPIEKLRVDEWEKIHDYFELVSHHNNTAIPEEFASWLLVLEQFLLDRLIPRTFEDHARIDEIIREGEGNAES